nr:mechanosensitive ion channel domain-containing protein [Ulvibacterium sp.]
MTYERLFYDYLLKRGMEPTSASYVNMLLLLVAVLLAVSVIDFILNKIFRMISGRIAKRTKTKMDNFFVDHKVPSSLAHVIPLILLFETLPIIFYDFDYLDTLAQKTLMILGVLLVITVIRKLLMSLRDYLRTLQRLQDKPLDSYIQVVMIFVWILGILTIFAIITDTTIWKFFTALGAASAVLLLIFRDTILGLVASIQVSINDMVRIGDWIAFEKYGADGSVIEITLATVKVQNWDMTITTIPTYALISDSFKNWRGMQNSGGRRIKRAMHVSQKSIRFLTPQDMNSISKIPIIREFLDSLESLETFAQNIANDPMNDLALNGPINIGLFRKYIQGYLESNSKINQEMTLMVRVLEPTTQGVPVEVYAFSASKKWEEYETLMADIFDHLIAVLPFFYLEIFELPTSLK